MSRITVSILLAFAAGMLAIMTGFASGQNISIDTQRWDLMLIKEAKIWKNLLVNYGYAEHQRFWPERRAALRKIINEYPNSRWADDAALILACGKASFENNISGAIADLKIIADRYPDGMTIVTHWDPDDGCKFDEVWLMWQGGLVFLDPEGTIRTAKPFDRDGEISQLEGEGLAYFRHLEIYPVATAVMAHLFRSQMLERRGDRTGAILALKNIVENSTEYLGVVSRADKIAASESDGYHIRSLVRRPEYRAYVSLIAHYERQEKMDEAVAVADTLCSLYGKDGWLWSMNRNIGDFYQRQGFESKAKEQYQLSLTGLLLYKEDIEKRGKLVKGTDIPKDFWDNNRRELEGRLKEK